MLTHCPRTRPFYMCFLFATALLLTVCGLAEESVDFNRDIRPLLASKCFACHGPDESHREADLRLDDRQAAVEAGAIMPANPAKSELLLRLASTDPDERMPPSDAAEALTEQQQSLFRRWIAEGAKYDQHWAFVPPTKSPLPAVTNAKWPKNAIDHFVLAQLEAAGRKPSPEADRYALVRRVYLDLIGLPPTPNEADAFVHDDNPKAYEQLVDRLLDSKQYGERWARDWLDLARYADTNGYEKDRPRSIWPYRDWVIRAINADMPFDQFTIEQLAGDMLPDATEAQIIATGFHRNTMLNEEGGIDPLEYRFYAMVDRVATTGITWLGLSTGCAQCHTHKYDPITHTDYYRLMALMNNADEPDLRVKTSEAAGRRDKLETEIDRLQTGLAEQFPPAEGDEPIVERRRKNLDAKFQAWLSATRTSAHDWQTIVPTTFRTNLPRLEVLEDGSLLSTGDITKRDVFTLQFDLKDFEKPLTGIRLEVLPDERLPAGGPGRAFYEGRKGDFFLSEVTGRWNGEAIAFVSPSHSYGKISIGSGGAKATNVIDGNGSTGWSTAQREGEAHQLVLNLKAPIEHDGQLEIELLFERHFAASLGRFRFSALSHDGEVTASQLPVDIERLLAQPEKSLDDVAIAELKSYYLSVAPELADARKPIERLRKQLPNVPTTMVMRERPADNIRKTFLHHRGEFLSPKEAVTPGLPAFLTASAKVSEVADSSAPTNRLEFARWLASDANPLVGRVTVNRTWQAFFGTGLQRTANDFGTQVKPPTHPKLLDWLACDFIENGWSMKQLHRQIVTSATYRQQSTVTPETLRQDPQNELLGRGPRFRANAEMVRDIMLQASGLLSPKMHGPSVYPPQPSSVTALAYGGTRWNVSKGEDRYRRSLYTFSKRTAPFAAYSVFDAPTGESCVASRDRSNTPLQALTLLNDEMYVEMARALAKLAMSETADAATDSSPEESNERIAKSIFRRLLTRPPTVEETAKIATFQQAQHRRIVAGELQAKDITADSSGSAELAAWTMVARAIMNLDEAITKP